MFKINGIIRQILECLEINKVCVVAIDGYCGSGKTTLARNLSQRLGDIGLESHVFHMDDFYVPSQLKTVDRMNTPGGNVHFERFEHEVLKPIKMRQPVFYRPFDCASNQLTDLEIRPYCAVNIIEGSYALHPKLIPYYHIRYLLRIDSGLQQQRILKRSNQDVLERFNQMWIPLEMKYFNAYYTCEKIAENTAYSIEQIDAKDLIKAHD